MPSRLFSFFFDKDKRFLYLSKLGIYNKMQDEKYIKRVYDIFMKHNLDLTNPIRFSEKLQWLKLYDRKPIYTTMVDKYQVKSYISEKIGEEYVIPTIGVWESEKEIDFEHLPNQFVLKCTHDSGGIVLCENKEKLNPKTVRRFLKRRLHYNYFYGLREWPYKNVKPRIIAEPLIGIDLMDYKMYCFNGEVKYVFVSIGERNSRDRRVAYLTREWEFAPFQRDDHIRFETLPQKPRRLSRMMDLAENLSKDIPFVRVDYYEKNDCIFFGEFTFYPSGGFINLQDEWDINIGEWLQLPSGVASEAGK